MVKLELRRAVKKLDIYKVYKGILVIMITWLLLPPLGEAQTNEGTDFWFGFMEHVDVTMNEKVVLITSKSNTSGTIEIT